MRDVSPARALGINVIESKDFIRHDSIMSTVTIRIPEYLRKQVEKLSVEEGVSIDQFFATDVLRHIPASAEVGDWDRISAKLDG